MSSRDVAVSDFHGTIMVAKKVTVNADHFDDHNITLNFLEIPLFVLTSNKDSSQLCCINIHSAASLVPDCSLIQPP